MSRTLLSACHCLCRSFAVILSIWRKLYGVTRYRYPDLPFVWGKLEFTEDIERFACGYCGNEHLVRRGGGVVSLQPVLEKLEEVQATTERAASELAIPRLEREIKELYRQRAQITEKKEEGWTGISGLILMLGPIVLLVAIFTNFKSTLANLICGAVWLGAVVFFALYFQRLMANKQTDARAAALDEEITAKRMELDRHKQRIESGK